MAANNKTTTTFYQPMKYKLLYFILSLLIILPGTYSLLRYGLKFSVEFTGGSVLSFTAKPDISIETLKQAMVYNHLSLRDFDHQNNLWRLTTSPLSQEQESKLIATLSQHSQIQVKEFYTVGATLGKELVLKTIYGLLLAASLILIYIALRFRNFKFGVSAVVAMLHDALVLLGVFSLLGHFYNLKVDSLFVTAVLTVLSFSVYDTVVVYDRIRELQKHHPYLDFETIVNRAVVEIISRSLNNSLTIIFMLLAMYLLGGSTIRNFVLALLIGTVSGTYSSTFNAVPLLVVWHNWEEHRRHRL